MAVDIEGKLVLAEGKLVLPEGKWAGVEEWRWEDGRCVVHDE